MGIRLFLIWISLTVGSLAWGLASSPSWERFLAMLLGIWVLPGWALARWIQRKVGLSPLERAVATVAAPPLLFGYLATPLSLLHVHPAWISLSPIAASAIAGVVTVLRRDARSQQGPRFSLPSLSTILILAVAVGLALIVSHVQPISGVTSDSNAHIAATGAALQEGEVFPRHEFYADAVDAGPDPRFGVLHAWYAGLAWWGGVEPPDVWRWLQPLGSWLWITALAALSAGICRTRRGFAVAWLLFLGSYIGTISNPLAFGMTPFYVGFAIVLTAMGAAWHLMPRRLGAAIAAVAIVGAGQMHAMAFLLGCLLLVAAFLADKPNRSRWAWGLGVLAALALPWMSLRFLFSYSSANPINAWPFQIVTWGKNLKGASPDYLFARMSGPGLLILPLAPWLWKLKTSPEGRWLLLLCFGLLVWVVFPPTFALSWALVSLLTLRLTMAILFPLLWGLWVELPSAAAGGRRFVRWGVIAVIVILGGMGLAGRLRPSRLDSANDFQRLPQWEELVDVVRETAPANGVILSDPFTMLALRARLPQHIVAVPGGRSSPRDASSLQRLRDAWVAMSFHGDPQETEGVLQKYGVTHVVLNQAYTEPLHDIECEIDPQAFPEQRVKFETNPDVFHLRWHAAGFWLYEVRPEQVLQNLSYFQPCVDAKMNLDAGMPLTGGLALASAQVDSSRIRAGDRMDVGLQLTYGGEGQAPHRRLAIRLDSLESPVPRFLSPVDKPVRKLMEMSTGRKWRARWTVGAGPPGCVSSQLRRDQVMTGEYRLTIPRTLAPGRYELTVQAVRVAPFNVPDIRDFFRDEDFYRGQVVATVQVLPPLSAGLR